MKLGLTMLKAQVEGLMCVTEFCTSYYRLLHPMVTINVPALKSLATPLPSLLLRPPSTSPISHAAASVEGAEIVLLVRYLGGIEIKFVYQGE
ncbi:hypothetical protein GmHk_05G012620 [Glycine max]|nr:hypothetical protein GmHk_05G012620 [Glycine max]